MYAAAFRYVFWNLPRPATVRLLVDAEGRAMMTLARSGREYIYQIPDLKPEFVRVVEARFGPSKYPQGAMPRYHGIVFKAVRDIVALVNRIGDFYPANMVDYAAWFKATQPPPVTYGDFIDAWACDFIHECKFSREELQFERVGFI